LDTSSHQTYAAKPRSWSDLGTLYLSKNHLALFLCLLTVLFESKVYSAEKVGDQNLESVILQLKWQHGFQFAGYYAAIDKGFYREVGLEVELVEHLGADSPVSVLLRGKANYAVSGPSVAVNRALGEPVVALAAIFQHSPYAFLVREDSGIQRVEDFVGKRVSIGAQLEHVELLATLRRAGLEDEDYIQIPNNFDSESLIRGETDVYNAYVTNQGFVLEQAGFENRYILPSHYGIDFYGDILTTTEKEILDHPKRVQTFLQASLKGWKYALRHEDEVIELILGRYNTQNYTREQLEYEARASRELIQPLLVPLGHMNPDRWEHIREIFVDLEFIDPEHSIGGLVYNSKVEDGGIENFITENFGETVATLILGVFLILIIVLVQGRRIIFLRTQELAESERHWRELITAEPAGVMTTDETSKIISLNPAGLELLQATSEAEVEGRQFVDFILEGDRPEYERLNKQTFEGEVGTLKFRICGLQGKEVSLETYAVPFRDGEGQIKRQLSVIHDITEQLSEHARSKELGRELSQRHKMEALGQLSGGVAHDFNNLLSIIQGNTELVLNEKNVVSAKERAEYLHIVLDATDRAAELVTQMMVFSRLDRSEEASYDLALLIKKDIKMLRSVLPSSVEVESVIAEDLPPVIIDPVQLQQILMNLCINARDAMNGIGKLTISLSHVNGASGICQCCRKQIAGRWIELAVEDNGCGIEKDQMDRIFEPFYTTKPIGEGTGMGLSVIHGIMGRSDRHVLVDSRRGRGSTFRMLFTPVERDIPSVAPPIPAKVELALSGSDQRILIVDDERDVADIVGRFLTMAGYQTTIVYDSLKALDKFLEDPKHFDMVITDQTMPGLTGTMLARKIKALREDIPVILCSGFNSGVESGEEAGFCDVFIAKPYEMKELLAIVATIFANAHSGERHATPNNDR
jgi:two-component system cell cycle sensor histidine kinase/response regulator CckA